MMSNRGGFYFFLYLLMLTIVNAELLGAQSGISSAISGMVEDSTGAVLPSVAVPRPT